MKADTILEFWFKEIPQESWFRKDEAFDRMVTERFGALFERAAQGGLSDWRLSAQGRLAEIIVLDQFPRNMFRGTPKSFAADPLALQLAQEAVAAGADRELPIERKAFLYMPYMHSEDLAVHEQAVALFSQKGLENNLKFEIAHKEIIERFGRYPHRNEVLGRVSTPEEIAFLKQPGSSF